MRIASVTIEGLKGQHAALELSPRTLLVGPVGAGKSAVSEAIRFAALGFVPSLGRLEAATGKLLCGHELKVEVTLDDGRVFHRTLSNGGKYRSFAWASWVPASATPTQHGDAIRALFGASLDEASECLDLRELLRAGPTDRAQKINALLDATGATAQERTARLREHAIERLTEGKGAEYLPPPVAEVLGQVDFTTLFALTLDVAIEKAKTFKKCATDEAKRQSAARAVAPVVPDAPRDVGPRPEGDPVALELEAGKLADQAEQVPFPPAPIHQMEPCREAEALEEKASEIEIPDDPDVASVQASLQAAERDLALAKESPWREVERIADAIDNPTVVKAYPHEAATLRQLAEKHGKSPRGLQRQVRELGAAVAQAQAAADTRRATLASRAQILAAAAKARQAWTDATRDRAARTVAEHNQATTAAKARVRELMIQAEGKRRQAADIRVAQDAWEASRKRAAALPEQRARAAAEMVAAQRKAECERDVWAALEWGLLRVREKEIEGRAEPIVSRIAEFFQKAGIDRKPFVRVSKGAIDFGWDAVSIETMSGGETALFMTALAKAVIEIRRPSVPVLMVEAAEADDNTVRQIMAGVNGSEVSVIVATCHGVDAAEGWERIDVAAQAGSRF